MFSNLLGGLFILLSIEMSKCVIEFPVSHTKYISINEKIIENHDKYFEGWVYNLNTFTSCNYKCVGLLRNESDVNVYPNAIAFITSENNQFKEKYDKTILGLEEKYINYSLEQEIPFSVRYYDTRFESNSLKFGFFVIVGIVLILYAILKTNMCYLLYLCKPSIYERLIYKQDMLMNEACTICLDDFKDDEAVVKIKKCSHLFHKQCIKEWLKNKDKCPNCNCIV